MLSIRSKVPKHDHGSHSIPVRFQRSKNNRRLPRSDTRNKTSIAGAEQTNQTAKTEGTQAQRTPSPVCKTGPSARTKKPTGLEPIWQKTNHRQHGHSKINTTNLPSAFGSDPRGYSQTLSIVSTFIYKSQSQKIAYRIMAIRLEQA